MSETIEQMLIRHEGKISYAYQDSLGYWTIGVGRLIDKRKGGGLSDLEITYLLQNDINRVKNDLDRMLPWWGALNEDRQAVLIDMCFNLGIAGLLEFKKTLALLKEDNYEGAGDEMLNSDWAKQVGHRAIELSKLMKGE
jgi:lysozyme